MKSSSVSAASYASLGLEKKLSSVEELFVESEDNQTQRVNLVARSEYDVWKSEKLKSESIDLYKDIGIDLSKWPGARVVMLEGSKFALFDDSCAPSKVNFAILFSSLLKEQKSPQTLYFTGWKNENLPPKVANRLAYAWTAHSYKLKVFKKTKKETKTARLVWPKQSDRAGVLGLARATYTFKDLVDSPALTIGPQELGDAAAALAREFGCTPKVIVGVDALCNGDGFPQTAAVGQAAAAGREPRVVEWEWQGQSDNDNDQSTTMMREVVIIGKGITFDTGGLNIKGPSMKGMKRDMAGAAQALALASMIMHSNLKCKLRVIIPIAENSVAGNAIRPSDIIRSRNGKTTEITNTDAEGRLILADALVAACENPVDSSQGLDRRRIVIDFATLTGAARVALGGELPALFSNDHQAQMELFALSQSHEDSDPFEGIDPVWPLPLWEPMRGDLKSPLADMVNAPGTSGGAITAALYLSEFITPLTSEATRATAYLKGGNGGAGKAKNGGDGEEEEEGESEESDGVGGAMAPIWMHVDFPGGKPGGMRAVYAWIQRLL
jgi:leucyl aminopeptidase